MPRSSPLSNTVFGLVAAGLILPVVIAVTVGLGALLTAMGDEIGGLVTRYVALACGAGWLIVLIGLILVLAIRSLWREDEGRQ